MNETKNGRLDIEKSRQTYTMIAENKTQNTIEKYEHNKRQSRRQKKSSVFNNE